ncbi:MAG: hypothetical protein DCF22_21105 [Leptolyngbya sp.]|nr:MAG: hypothetical protein DCF22_21105 [Leptolyngbya sp.]
MTVEELTAIATAHQSAISRHNQEMAEFRAALRQSSEQHNREMSEFRENQEQSSDRHNREMSEFRENQEQASDRHNRDIEAISRLAQLNQEQLNLLTAGLLELRTLVADYLQGRSQT